MLLLAPWWPAGADLVPARVIGDPCTGGSGVLVCESIEIREEKAGGEGCGQRSGRVHILAAWVMVGNRVARLGT